MPGRGRDPQGERRGELEEASAGEGEADLVFRVGESEDPKQELWWKPEERGGRVRLCAQELSSVSLVNG